MRDEFLPFSRPSISNSDIEAVGDVLHSGWITTGSKTEKFEQNFCEFVGCRKAVALSSATGAMHLLLQALNIGSGDEVITPSLTWVSTINLITLSGATPIFADIDKDTLMVTDKTIEKCITPRTRLILPVHFAGAPADLDKITKLANKHNIPVVQDAAHAIGTYYKGTHIGKTGSTIFSFHPTKNITTGEGGMFCSDNAELVQRIKNIKFHGLGVNAYDRRNQGRSPQAEVIEPGFKYNLTDMASVLGLKQLERINIFNQKRSELAEIYTDKLSEIDEIMPLKQPNYPIKHAWHLFVVRLDIDKIGFSRDEFMYRLKQKNIGTGLHFKAVHLQKYYVESMGFKKGMLPNTEWNSDRICSLPLFPDMKPEDIDDVIGAIKEVLKK